MVLQMSMDIDDVPKTDDHPEDFAQLVKLLEFLSDPIIYPPKGKMQDNISLEVFVNICDHLPPQDLLMLSCVCKNFANMLNADIFSISSDIWKSSREHFTVFKDMDPPKGMSQKRFVQLLNFGKGCEICKSKEKKVQIYWPAFVRSCKDCIFEKAKSALQLEYEHQIDKNIIDGTPPLVPCPDDGGKTQYYWLPHAISAQKELQAKSESDSEELNKENIERHLLVTRYWNEQVTHQQNKVQTIVREFYEKKALNTSDMSNPVIKNLMSKITINPFVEQDFDSFIEELKTVVKRDDNSTNHTEHGYTIMDTIPSKDVKPNRSQKRDSLRTHPVDYELPRKEKEASVPLSKYTFDYGTPAIRPMPPIISNGQFMDTSGSQMKTINPIPSSQMKPIRPNPQINPVNAPPPVTSFQMNPINAPMANHQMNQINHHMPHIPPKPPMPPQNRNSQLIQRRQDIIKLLKNVVFAGTPKTKVNAPFTININDPIFRFLDCCESFKNPPFFQPNDNNKYDIILKLKQEAHMLNDSHKGGIEPRHILDVRGAVDRQLGNHPLFKCSKCRSTAGGGVVKVYRKILTHLVAVHGIMDKQRQASYIEVDPKSVVNYIHFAFIPEIRPKNNIKL
ncbi:f-box domain contaning protein [Gigaspora margarita]|uniref:F-box domain contaning protein n=2 Tax=Gigaspora margarita TaxID=4874 RepID=A0A8H3ZZ07_GIGMA|nr:f-box domain contaning protein [Gigaspora margarita]